MATPSIMNAGQRTGAYAPGSIAAMPRRHAGGVRRRDEDPGQFRDRMDMSALTHGQMPAGITPPGMAQIPGGNRTDRIIAARVDGSFDTKRNQFNAANAGKLVMDQAGNIGPGSGTAPASVNPVNSPPPVNPVTPPAAVPPSPGNKPPTPAQMAANMAAGAAGGPVAAGMSQVGGAAAAMRPRKPATFESKTMEQFKAQRPTPATRPATSANPAARRTASGEFVIPGNAMDPNARWNKPATPSAVTPPMAAQAPAAAAPATAQAAQAPATSITTADQAWAKTQKTLRPTPMGGPGAPTLEGRAQALQDAARISQSTQGPMPRPMSNKTTLPPHLTAPANGFSPEFHRQFDPVSSRAAPAMATTTNQAPPPAQPPASTRLNAAQTQATKNPQGLSARLNPPNAAPVTLEEDPIAKPIIAAGKAVGNVLSSGGFTIADSIRNQAAKNPGGLAAKIRRFTGMTNGQQPRAVVPSRIPQIALGR